MKSRFLILTFSVLQRLGSRKMIQQHLITMICALFIDVMVTEEAAVCQYLLVLTSTQNYVHQTVKECYQFRLY